MVADFVPNKVIVKLEDGVSPTEFAELQAAMGATKVTTAEQFGIHIVEIASGRVPDIISTFSNDARVKYIEPDYKMTLPVVPTTSPTQQNLATTTPPNDLDFPKLWGLHNTGQTGGESDADIDALEAWNIIQPENPHIVVAVIDSGVDYAHRDLAANMWKNSEEMNGIEGIDDDGNGKVDDKDGWDFQSNDNNPMDENGHGTHVAGTIAAVGNNGEGVIGVGWQKVKIMPLKFMDASGSGNTSDAIFALEYAVGEGAKITNNSWGSLLPIPSQALEEAIQIAGELGALFIAAAGNSSQNTDVAAAYPASYPDPSIISVAATDDNDDLAYYSNYGKNSVDLAAPGSDIWSTLPRDKNGIEQYGSLSGTSMASPHVAGAVALVWSQNPSWTAAQVKQKVMGSTDDYFNLLGVPIGGLLSKAGRLNLFKALGGSTSNKNSNLGPIPLRIASTLSPAVPANLTETAKGETEGDPLTGGTAADTLRLPFAQSSVSPKDPLTHFGSEKIDLVPQGGAAIDAPSLFSHAAHSTVPTLEKGAIPLFTQAKGALAGNEALGIKSDPLAVAKTSPLADSYLVGIYDATKQLGF